MKKLSRLLIFQLILCVLILFAYFLLNKYVYANTLRSDIALSLLAGMIINIVIHALRNFNTEFAYRLWERLFFNLIIFAAVILIVMAKPNYTYQQAQDIVVAHSYESLQELSLKSIWAAQHFESDGPEPNAYLFAGEKEGEAYYILVNINDGKIATEKLGDSYIDRVFEMRDYR